MRAIIIIASGFFVLFVFILVSRARSDNNKAAVAKAALVFLPLWLLAGSFALWKGVSYAGYSAVEEGPLFIIIFGLPAALAFYLWRKFSGK